MRSNIESAGVAGLFGTSMRAFFHVKVSADIHDIVQCKGSLDHPHACKAIHVHVHNLLPHYYTYYIGVYSVSHFITAKCGVVAGY